MEVIWKFMQTWLFCLIFNINCAKDILNNVYVTLRFYFFDGQEIINNINKSLMTFLIILNITHIQQKYRLK